MGMYKSCPNCGGIHTYSFGRCFINKSRYIDTSITRFVHRSSKAKNLAKIVKEDSNGLCAVCLDDNVYNTKDLEIHHIIKIRSKPDMAYDEDNLICLCRFHHHMAENGLLKVSYLRKLVKKRKTPPCLE